MQRPLSRNEFLVLMVLMDGPLHGYGVVKAIAERTDGGAKLRPANLYRILDRLVVAGLLEETEGTDEASNGGERTRFFVATASGRRAVRAEAELLARVIGGSDAMA